MPLWRRFLVLLGLGEHAEFIWGVLDWLGLTRPINWILYAAGSGISGVLAKMAEWPPIAIFLAVIGTGTALAGAYGMLHAVSKDRPTGSRSVLSRTRIFIEHGQARSDEPLNNVTHLELLTDGTVLIEFNKKADPASLKVREEGKQPLEILERGPQRVRFKWTPPENNLVKVIIVEGILL